jgi:hypothetical protein
VLPHRQHGQPPGWQPEPPTPHHRPDPPVTSPSVSKLTQCTKQPTGDMLCTGGGNWRNQLGSIDNPGRSWARTWEQAATSGCLA